jgi:hypothetical protein
MDASLIAAHTNEQRSTRGREWEAADLEVDSCLRAREAGER